MKNDIVEIIFVSAVALFWIIRLCIRGWWNDKTQHDLEVLGSEFKETESEDEKQ